MDGGHGQLDELDRAIEALVLVAERPVESGQLAQLLEIPVEDVDRRCAALEERYAAGGHGFELVRVAGGYVYRTRAELAPYVERVVLEGQATRLSAAALETLAIVAYKQPISRAQITAIRGVNVDGVVRTLLHRDYITEVGRDDGPGQAVLYGTTARFLERLGLDTVADLPAIGEMMPGADVVEALERTLLDVGDPRRRTRGEGGGTSPDDASAPAP